MRNAGFAEMIDFTRPGSATYVDADGLIRIAAADVPRFDHTNGRRQLFFEVDGNPIAMYVVDKASMEGVVVREKATDAMGSVGAPMPGKVVGIRVEEGMVVAKDTPLVVLSAMKMETIVKAPITGLITSLTVAEGEDLAGNDLLVEIVPTESIRMP